MMKGRHAYRLSGQRFETLSKCLVAAGGVISFSAGVYNIPTLSFVAGAVSTLSLACLQFSSFSYKESKAQTRDLNAMLRKLKIDTLPMLDMNSESKDPKESKETSDVSSTTSKASSEIVPQEV